VLERFVATTQVPVPRTVASDETALTVPEAVGFPFESSAKPVRAIVAATVVSPVAVTLPV